MKRGISLLLLNLCFYSLLLSQSQSPNWDVCDGFLIDEQNETCIKVNSDDWQNAELTSFNHLLSNQNGHVMVKMDTTLKDVSVGLSIQNDGRHYSTIDYAFYFHENGDVWIIENGNLIQNMGVIPHGEWLYIKRTGGNTIKYTIRSQVQYTSLMNTSGELYVDISAKNQDQIIRNVKVNFLNTCSNIWGQEIGVTYDGTDKSLKKNSTTNSWTSSYVISDNYITSSENGAIQFRVANNAMNKGFGFLPDGLSSYSPSDFLHAFYFNQGVAHIFENGRVASRLDASHSGERYAITKTGSTIKYYKNGTLVYTSSTYTTDNMVMGASLYNSNGNKGFKYIECSFQNSRITTGQIDLSNIVDGELIEGNNLQALNINNANEYQWMFLQPENEIITYVITSQSSFNPLEHPRIIPNVEYEVSVAGINEGNRGLYSDTQIVKIKIRAPKCLTLKKKLDAGHYVVRSKEVDLL